MTSTHTLRFLGTGASCGVPSFYCGCKACEEALRDPAAQRGCAALLISGIGGGYCERTLIDAGPDLRMQLSLAGATQVERALITHEHFDHIGGIAQFEYYVRLSSGKPFPLYAGEHTLAAIAQQFAFMADTLEPHRIIAGEQVSFDGVRYTALPATHGAETFGFIIEREVRDSREELSHVEDQRAPQRIAYFPDTGPLAGEVLEELRGIDTLIIDATFHGRNWMPASHHTIAEAVKLALSLDARQTWLTHLAMHYDEPITAGELDELLAPYEGTIRAAYDGLELLL